MESFNEADTRRIDLAPTTISGNAETVWKVPPEPVAWLNPQQLAKRETPFYRMLECVYDAVFITSREGKIVECNERACEFFKLTADSLLGCDMITLISGADASLIDTVLRNLEDRRYTLVDGQCKRADGTSFAAEIAVNKMELEKKELLCFFVRDITVRKQAQTALQNAVERLQAHDRARMEFVSNVSHELRTPLTSMIYAVSNMLRGVVGPLPEKAVHYLERLQSDCRRLLATVNDILDLRQVENNTLVLSKTLSPLSAIVREAVDTLQVQADTKHLRIVRKLGDREFFCLCDVQKMERVLLNIVGNAIKFTPSDGVITVSAGEDPQNPERVLLSCCDTGMGIPADKLPKISQRYFRVGNFVNGSGLGLAISREIVELHGGTMRFASPVPGTDKGTAVYVSLSLASQPLVVLLSDTPDGEAFLQKNVAPCGYGIYLASTAKDLLEKCIHGHPAVLLLDRAVTKVDIHDIILRLREDVHTKRLPILVLGKERIPYQESQLYRKFNVSYFLISGENVDLSGTLSLAVLGKLQ